LPALYQDDDDGNDLSDLGLSTGKKNSVDEDEPPQECPEVDRPEEEDVFCAAEGPVANADVKVATVTTTESSAIAENGYDRAIKDYVDFAESKRTKCDEQRRPPCRKPLVEMKRRMSAPRIEEKVMLLKTRSQSTKDLNSAVSELPRVDIVKRREIFEKICSDTKSCIAETQQQTSVVATRQPPPPPPPAKNKKSLEVLSVAVTVIRPQVIKEISPPESPPLPPRKINLNEVMCYFIYNFFQQYNFGFIFAFLILEKFEIERDNFYLRFRL